jgi:hypothetical protein
MIGFGVNKDLPRVKRRFASGIVIGVAFRRFVLLSYHLILFIIRKEASYNMAWMQ